MTSINLGYELLNYIVNKDLQEGDRLPSINDLQSPDHLGINTSKVREQLEVARALGIVDVRPKVGTHIKAYSFAQAIQLSLLFSLAQNIQLFDLYNELRVHIEVSFWDEACQTLSEPDKERMRQSIASARTKLKGSYIEIPNKEHETFHMTMFEKLDNPFVTGILEAYWEAYRTVETKRYVDYGYMQKVWDYHERILDLICKGDYNEAKIAYIEHTKLLRYHPEQIDSNHS